jgi:thiol-disulfide isomerase/thioredoxin
MPIAHPKLQFALLALVASFGAGLISSAVAAGVKVGDAFPDLATFKLEGKLPDSLKDKVVMIDFWASWCDPCRDSFPTMEELHKKHGPKGLVVIAVNVDENRRDMEAFLKKNPASFLVVRDAGQKLVEKAAVATMPSSFLIDREGKVRFVHAGYRGEETRKKYEQEIESLLKK